MRTIAYALLGALLLGSALVKDSDRKAYRSAYEDSLKQLEDEKRPAARVQLLADLEGHIDKLCKVDGEKTVKFLLEAEVAASTGSGRDQLERVLRRYPDCSLDRRSCLRLRVRLGGPDVPLRITRHHRGSQP